MQNLTKRVLLVGLIISVAVVIYSYFTFGLINIHSDNAVELLAIKSIFENRDITPKSWVYCNGDINLMRIQAFLLLPYLIFKDWAIARECGALIITLFSSGSIILLCRKMLKDDSWLIAIPIYLIFISGAISRDVSMYSGMYTSIVFYTNILILLFYRIYSENEKRHAAEKIVYIGLMILLLTGGVRWIAEMTLPMIGTIFIMKLMDWKTSKDDSIQKYICDVIRLMLFVILPSIIGFVIYQHVRANGLFFVNSQEKIVFDINLEFVLRNTVQVIKNIYKCFGYNGEYPFISLIGLRNVVTLVIGTVCFIIVPILQLVRMKTESMETRFFIVYAYSHNMILLAASILLGKLIEYHVISVVFFSILLSSRYIWTYWVKNTNYKGVVVVAFLVIGIIIESLFMLSKSVGWKDKYISERSVIKTIQEHGLTKGYGDFWTAYNNELYSNGNIKMGAVRFGNDYFETYNCLCDTKVFDDSQCPSFIIFTEDQFELYADRALVLFGPTLYDWEIENVPVYNHLIYTWEDKKIIIWAWDYDIATRLNNGVNDGVLKANELIFNWVGTRTEDSIIMENGGVINGPYSTIYKGDYLLSIKGENIDKIVYGIDSLSYENAISYSEISRTQDNIEIQLHINESIDDVNFSLTNKENDTVVFNYIEVEKVS